MVRILQVFDSGTDEKVQSNGAAPPDDDEPLDKQHDYSTLFDAPSYSDFIKTQPNSKAKSYERRVQSMVKAGMIASLNNENYPDAATFLKHGPGFAKAAGNLAAEDAHAAHIIEMLTAPDSPYIMFVMVGIPLVAQLFRNHQSDFEQAGSTFRARRAQKKQAQLSGVKLSSSKPPITVHIFKREFKLPIRFRVRFPNIKNMFKGFLAPTQNPQAIAAEVFSDPAVVKALHKMGLFPREREHAQN